MTRAKSELLASLCGALTLVVFLAWYQGYRSNALDAPAPVTGQVVRSGPVPQPAPEPLATPVAASSAGTTTPELLPPDVLEEDRAFINEAFPVLSSWTVSEVKPLLSVAARAGSTDEELAAVMKTLEDRLGTLQYFEAPQPVAVREELDRDTLDTTAELQPYQFTAYYEAGAAEVNLVLEKRPLQSSLYSFDINIPN